MIACIGPPQNRCLSAGRIRSDVPRQEIKPRLVHKHDGPAFDVRLFLSRGQTWRRHCSITASSRWVARSIGICGVQCKRFNNRETWALWYQTPHSSPITVATRAQVQHSPWKPYAAAPWDKSSGIKRHWSPASLIGPVGWSVRGLSIRIWTDHCAKKSQRALQPQTPEHLREGSWQGVHGLRITQNGAKSVKYDQILCYQDQSTYRQ
jgi:hypothetical protein